VVLLLHCQTIRRLFQKTVTNWDITRITCHISTDGDIHAVLAREGFTTKCCIMLGNLCQGVPFHLQAKHFIVTMMEITTDNRVINGIFLFDNGPLSKHITKYSTAFLQYYTKFRMLISTIERNYGN